MKRLLIVASVAILAAGCQKTFVQDEVQTPIGFSTEVGKQTRAIVQQSGENSYLTSQPFAVYAYGHQDAGNGDVATTIMNNVEIFYDNDDKWRANDGLTYYWPNDPRTEINFYAYSPSYSAEASATNNHQKLNGRISHSETAGLSLTDYIHSNMYVDFMVGRPVLEAFYNDQDGSNGSVAGLTSVPVSFNHQMTQVVFTVKTNKPYGSDTSTNPDDDVTFTVKSITLNKVNNNANYAHSTLAQSYQDVDSKFKHGVWEDQTGQETYTVFPAVKLADDQLNGNPDIQANEVATVVTNTTVLTTTPVTMIPQNLATSTQSFTIVYDIAGAGVATETVSKTVDLNTGSHTAWGINQKVTYNIIIGLNEITFSPTVVGWESSYDHDGNDQTPDVNYGADVNI